MRILITEPEWLDGRAQFTQRGIEFVLRPRAAHEANLDGLLVPPAAWPIAPSRKHWAPVVVYGPRVEVAHLIDEPAVSVLEVDRLQDWDSTAAAVADAFERRRVPFFTRRGSGTMRSPVPPPPDEANERPSGVTLTPAQKRRFEDECKRAGLSERQRQTMMLRLDHTREKTAELMNVADATVRAQTTLALHRLGVSSVEELRSKIMK